MNETPNPLGPVVDLVQPFQVEGSRLRGRMVRLGTTLDEVLSRHAYPEAIANILAETMALTALLASMLKYEGVFSLQAKGDGPLRLMVADVGSDGAMRAYAQFDAQAVEAAAGDIAIAPAPALLGTGHIAFTVDQGAHSERYQGIVALYGKTLADCVQQYFRQSEQIDTGITVATGREPDGRWRAGGLMLQRLPDAPGVEPDDGPLASDREDGWRRAMVLMSTVGADELIGPDPRPNDVLFRLFHEDGVRVWSPSPLRFGCRCSQARVGAMLAGMPRAEVEEMKVDGQVEVICQFCSSAYHFDAAAIEALFTGDPETSE